MQINETEREVWVYSYRLPPDHGLKPREISGVGRQLLGHALKSRFGITEYPLEIGLGEHGKPFLAAHPGIEFNISHSGLYVIVAVSDVPVGIDVEEAQDRNLASIARYAFSPDELKRFEESEDRTDTFFRIWVCKEAFVKWTGEGITDDLKKLPMNGWHQFVDLEEGYLCAVHAEKPMLVKVEEVRNL